MSEGRGPDRGGAKRAREGRTRRPESGPSGADVAGVGLQFAASILVFLFLGKWLDGKLGTAPWLMVIGVFLGAAGGMYSMYLKLLAPKRPPDEPR